MIFDRPQRDPFYYRKWGRWFAWRPVAVSDRKLAWLEFVERRDSEPLHDCIVWEYRRAGEEENSEIRKIMLERYTDRYVLDHGVTVVNHDHSGILYRMKIHRGEDILMVRVLNSTPEPDGTMSREEAIAIFGDAAKAAVDAPIDARFKEYMIRVPPNMTKASEAVAWTFGLSANEYQPDMET